MSQSPRPYPQLEAYSAIKLKLVSGSKPWSVMSLPVNNTQSPQALPAVALAVLEPL